MFYENLNLTIKLFDSLVKPVLLYASDFWGCFEFASSDKSPFEKLNTTLSLRAPRVLVPTPSTKRGGRRGPPVSQEREMLQT